MKELITIQNELKAPKGQYNSFGKYKYRSAEDILEAVKPLLAKTNCTLTLSDEIVQIGERYYVKATAQVKNDSGSEETVAYAREEETKKGMDGAQVTGTASSYARKYALNGLFCIDDTKDPDTDEYTKRTQARSTKKQDDSPADEWDGNALATESEKKIFLQRCENLGVDYKQIGKQAGATSMKTMTKEQHGKALIILGEIEEGKKE